MKKQSTETDRSPDFPSESRSALPRVTNSRFSGLFARAGKADSVFNHKKVPPKKVFIQKAQQFYKQFNRERYFFQVLLRVFIKKLRHISLEKK